MMAEKTTAGTAGTTAGTAGTAEETSEAQRRGSNLFEVMFGRVIGDTLDRAQWKAEGHTHPTYENAVVVHRDDACTLEMYPRARGFVLKLVVDGVCTRQVQTGIMIANDGKPRVDLDSLSAGAKKLGVIMTGAAIFTAYAEALGTMETPPVVMTRKSGDGTVATFTVTGGMKRLDERTITIRIGTETVTGGPGDAAVKAAAAPFMEFVQIL